MPINLSTVLPAAATLGTFVEAIPALAAAPGAYGIFDTTPSTRTLVSGKVSEWNSRGGLNSKWVQTDDALRPTVDSENRVSMNGNSRMELAGMGTVPAFTLAIKFNSLFDTGIVQTIFAGTNNSTYARAFWSPTILRARFGTTAALRDVVPPSLPVGVVFVLNGSSIAMHAGGVTTTWTGTETSYVLTSLVIGSQTTSATPDSHLRFNKFGVWKSALTGTDLANARAWVGA